MRKIENTVDPRGLKDEELDVVGGGETNTSSFESACTILQAKDDASKVAIGTMR
jgi:hypothetical protein